MGPIAVFALLLASPGAASDVIVTVKSGEWELVGELRVPASANPVPAVLLLNGAARDRTAYTDLAAHLAVRGLGSLRLDLRGHGDSINAGRFLPAEADDADRERLIWNAHEDVIAAQEFLREHPRIDAARIAVVGASYSGEEAAEAGRLTKYARAYVMLSPGSLSAESIAAMDASGVPWLFVASRNERHLKEISAQVQETTQDVEILYLPGTEHADRILKARPDIAERIAVWLAQQL
jgi:dienelactone hydrolase